MTAVTLGYDVLILRTPLPVRVPDLAAPVAEHRRRHGGLHDPPATGARRLSAGVGPDARRRSRRLFDQLLDEESLACEFDGGGYYDVFRTRKGVITSYSIHYTKLYEPA